MTKKVVEEAWESFRYHAIPASAGPQQVHDMKVAFYSGAIWLFHHTMMSMDPGEEPTEADMDRMQKIHDELDNFAQLMLDETSEKPS